MVGWVSKYGVVERAVTQKSFLAGDIMRKWVIGDVKAEIF